MSSIRRIEQLLVGQVLFPLTNTLFNRRGILNRYNALMRTQFASPEEIRFLQYFRMKSLIENAGRHVPYYRKLFSRIGFDPGKHFKELADLRAIPPLSRKDVVEYRLDLVDERWRKAAEESDRANRPPGEPRPFAFAPGKNLVRNISSGSTGAPTVFYEDGAVTAGNWANELRLRSWFGVPPGARESRMARVSADYIGNSRSVVLRRWIWNQLVLPGISLKQADYAHCARELNRFEPQVLWGFTSAAAGLAHYVKEHPEAIPKKRLQLVITWAAPLYDHEKKILQEAFDCAITNIYGTREIGHIAARCPHGNLHINQESVYLETQEAANGTVSQPSELLATSLIPSPMPFIRYQTGDLGIVTKSQCACGRTLEEISEFTGRTGEVLVTADGRMISPNFWCRTFMDPQLGAAIRRFQVVYRSKTSILIRIVRGPSYNDSIECRLRTTVMRNLFGSVMLEFEYPAQIEAQVSGKYQMVVNETEKHREPQL